MDMNNPDVLRAYAEGYHDGHKVGWEQAKQEDVDMLKASREEPDAHDEA
jgi:hypothetical protein